MLISSVSQCIHIASIYTQTKRCIFRCILIILNCMLESHQHQDTILVDNGLNASASTIPWQIRSYTKCLKPFFICESSSLMQFDSFHSGSYFEIFHSISINLHSCTFSISHSLCLHHQTSDNKLPRLSALSHSARLVSISAFLCLFFSPSSVSRSLHLERSEICCCWGTRAPSQGWLLHHNLCSKKVWTLLVLTLK